MSKARIMGWVVVATLMAQPALAAGEYELRARIDKLERQLDSIQRAGGADGTVSAARLGVRISELEDAIRRSGGRTEEVQYQIEQLRKDFASFSEDVQLRLQTLEQSMPLSGMAAGMPTAPAGVATDGASPPAAAAAVMPMTPGATAPSAQAGRSMEDVVNEVSAPPATTPPAPAMKFNSPQEHYSHAFTLINRAQYAEAEQVLRSFVQQHPKDKLAGNAFYWLGETYYVRENYLNAADAFRQGFESLPDGSKAPDNLLKLGMSLGKLNKKDQACVVLKQLQVKYKGKADAVLQRAARESDVLGCAQ